MMDNLEREEEIRKLGFAFQKKLCSEFIDSVIRDTRHIPMTTFIDCCAAIKDAQGLPYNIAKTIKEIYYRIKPVTAINQQHCRRCDDTGVIHRQLYREPFTTWVEPCTCKKGHRFDWMQKDDDRPFNDFLRRQGVKFVGEGTVTRRDNYENV